MGPARRRQMKWALSLLALVIAALWISGIFAAPSGGSAGMNDFSNRGVAVALTDRGRQLLASLEDVRAYLLGVRKDRAFYRFETSSGACYGTGRATVVNEPGDVFCATTVDFPSAPLPVIASPAVELAALAAEMGSRDRTAHLRSAHLIGFEGFAADGVASVAFVAPTGTIIDRQDVSGNIFSLAVEGAEFNGTLVARDKDGVVVYSRKFP